VPFAVTVTDPADVLAVLEEAVHHARSGRPGPVWVNLPMNVPGALVDENSLRRFAPDVKAAGEPGPAPLQEAGRTTLGLLV
jgi:acetolactate synthase I/II/III large subunit